MFLWSFVIKFYRAGYVFSKSENPLDIEKVIAKIKEKKTKILRVFLSLKII